MKTLNQKKNDEKELENAFIERFVAGGSIY